MTSGLASLGLQFVVRTLGPTSRPVRCVLCRARVGDGITAYNLFAEGLGGSGWPNKRREICDSCLGEYREALASARAYGFTSGRES